MSEKTAADQVKDAAWVYTQRIIIVLLFFGAGIFLGYQKWGAAISAELEKVRKGAAQ